MSIIDQYILNVQDAVGRIPMDDVADAASLIYSTYTHHKTIIVIGNGGSAATASHFACDLSKSTITEGKRPIRAISLADNIPLITAWANDKEYGLIFEEQLKGYCQPDDLVFAISTSGNSRNIINAVSWANAHGATTIGLTGLVGGRLREIVDHSINVPHHDAAQTEDLHSIVCHAITEWLKVKISNS